MDVWQYFRDILENFHAKFPSFSKTSKSRKLLSSLDERGETFMVDISNVCKNNKNEKLYFAFDSVMKIVKSYLIRNPA